MDHKKLKELADDFKHYALVLLAVATFLYIGLWIPNKAPQDVFEKTLLAVASFFLLTASAVCSILSSKYQKKLDDIDT